MSYLYYLVQNRTLAEELAQDVFLKAFRARETYEPSSKLSTWLWTIARNTAYDHLRKKGERLTSDASFDTEDAEAGSPIEQVESPEASAEAALIDRSDKQVLAHCMESLTAPQREALSLRTLSDLSYDEIASHLGVSLGSVKALINRAKASLVKCVAGAADG